MMDIKEIISGLNQIENGFKHIMLAADEIYAVAGLDRGAVATGLMTGSK